ncbi:MAG: rRNA maturation RNase YbeY [Candidatus Eremiobacteraeota bacterium]|nr:rRNA maturation RNase YbeY [Candidatus Eremiobacteraeota bacterium]
MIHYRNATRGKGVDSNKLKSTARDLLLAAGEEESSLSLSLVGDREIRKLNRLHRGKDSATDVLSFPLLSDEDPHLSGGGERLLGDVVISVETAQRQAGAYDAALQDELYRLLIHGILHVLGHDHEEAGERARMEREERRLAAAIAMPWPYEPA